MCNFRVGMKVVCIDDDPMSMRIPGFIYTPGSTLNGLTKGKVYTVRDVFINPANCLVNLRLVEIVRPYGCSLREHAGVEAGFRVERFRPVVERKSDISIFTAMLNTQKNLVSA